MRKDENNADKWLAQSDIHASILGKAIAFKQVCSKLIFDIYLFSEDDIAKTSNTVIGIVRASLKLFKDGHPEITKINIRCDNAGCYHSQSTIQALYSLRKEFKELGLEIQGIHFCEPGRFSNHNFYLTIPVIFLLGFYFFRWWQESL